MAIYLGDESDPPAEITWRTWVEAIGLVVMGYAWFVFGLIW